MTNDMKNRIIFCVDHRAEDLQYVKTCLKPTGCSFFGMNLATECLEFIYRVKPSLILLAMELPGTDGIEACKLLRAVDVTRHVPIVMLTAAKTPENLAACVAAGGNDFLMKPVPQHHLVSRVRHWAGRHVGRRTLPPFVAAAS
jgi:CheY-like chemotaxis protein